MAFEPPGEGRNGPPPAESRLRAFRGQWLVLLLLALLPELLYVLAGYGGHDFSFHAASWLELHQAWSHHEWEFGWSPGAHWGFGEPQFCFYPPISLLIGTGLTFLLPFRLVPGVVAWLLLSAAGLSMYVAAGRMVASEHRLPAAILYMFNPYLVLTVILRYAIAEAWAQVLLPPAFLYFYVAATRGRARDAVLAGCLMGACWLTNIPEAIGIFYAFNLLGVVIAVWMRSARPLVSTAAAQGIALLLAAFRLAPALIEKKWVASQNLLMYDFHNYFQLKRIPPPHLVVYVCGAFIALCLLLCAPALAQVRRAAGRWRLPVIALASMGTYAVLLQFPVTSLLWEKVPQLKFVLFPYRLLPLLSLAVILLLLTGGVARWLRAAGVVSLGCFAVVPFFLYPHLFTFQRFPSITAAASAWQQGFEGVREYAPEGVPAERALPSAERKLAGEGLFHDQSCAPVTVSLLPNEKRFRTDSREPCLLVLNTFYYPFWSARIDDVPGEKTSRTAEGLLEVGVPAGKHEVRFEFLAASPVRTLAAAVSFLTFLAIALWLWLNRRTAVPLPDIASAN